MLQISISYPTTESYVQPDETITFYLSETTVEQVTFYLDFDDSVVAVTTDSTIGHSWNAAGSYSVNITAVTR